MFTTVFAPQSFPTRLATGPSDSPTPDVKHGVSREQSSGCLPQSITESAVRPNKHPLLPVKAKAPLRWAAVWRTAMYVAIDCQKGQQSPAEQGVPWHSAVRREQRCPGPVQGYVNSVHRRERSPVSMCFWLARTRPCRGPACHKNPPHHNGLQTAR